MRRALLAALAHRLVEVRRMREREIRHGEREVMPAFAARIVDLEFPKSPW